MDKCLELAKQLTFSEQQYWHGEFKKIDRVQGEHTDARFTHWFQNQAGPMQRGQDPLYSSQKQSIWKRFSQGPAHVNWTDWESTSEFDTDCDALADSITNSCQGKRLPRLWPRWSSLWSPQRRCQKYWPWT